MPINNVVVYRYDMSPYSLKVANILLLKGISHQQVDVSIIPPRPELELLGISYRRIPVLAIGRDVYIDSSLIASALERRFPPSNLRGSLFPPRKGGGTADTGLVKAFAMAYADKTIGSLSFRMLPWRNFPKELVEDRVKLLGADIDIAAMEAAQPQTASSLSSHMALVEEQLSDAREWLFDTTLPSLADISLHNQLAKLGRFPATKFILDETKFPKTTTWLSRMSDFLSSREAEKTAIGTKISGEEAAKLITSSPYDERLPFDETTAARLGFSKGALVSVAPDDNGRDVPTFGTLVGLDGEEVVIETSGPAGSVRCHFPRLYYTAHLVKEVQL